MRSVSRLLRYKNIYDIKGSESLFVDAMRENCRFQYDNSEDYRKILDGMNFSPDDVKDIDGVARIPFLPTLFFKTHRITSYKSTKHLYKATSSGTNGKFSEIWFDLGSLWSAMIMSLKILKHWKLISARPCNYIVFGYQPKRSNKSAVSKTAFLTTLLAPALHRTYALKYSDGKYEPDLETVHEAIQKYSTKKAPVRFMGFPSYTFFVMQMMEERGISVKLPKNSKIMLAGGWKQFYKEAVDKKTFYELARKTLGVEEENIIEYYGAVEHPILYADCPNHHFHVPVYSRVIIRDVNTFEPLPNGQTGLVNLITPLYKATPLLSVMPDDLGILHDGCKCGCGIESPYLEIIGRVGLKDVKTCAAGAADLLNTNALSKVIEGGEK